jgi:hypothetical protein
MDEVFKDITSVAMAIIGVAILSVMVSRNNNTVGVIGATSQGFGNVLSVAMGGSSNGGVPMISGFMG